MHQNWSLVSLHGRIVTCSKFRYASQYHSSKRRFILTTFSLLESQKLNDGIVSTSQKIIKTHVAFLTNITKDIISIESKSRAPGTLKGSARYLKTPGIISLGGGLPCSENFPIEQIAIKIPSAPHFSEQETKESGVIATAGKYDVSEGKAVYDLSIALNYGQGTGSAQLLRFVTEHTEIVCNPPYADWQCALSVGSTSASEQSYRIFCERGDYILTEEYTFTTAVETALPMGVKVVGIKMDSEGLLPDVMDEILTNWDAKARGAKKPHLLYTIPSGQNPTGATLGTQRRKELYKVCQKHDIFILEDEPYYFLQMQPYTGANTPDIPPPSSNEEFLKSLVPTLLSMDVDGRVMRLDSFSKVIAPGTRTGWITASEQIVERFVRHNEVCSQNPSGISQIVLYKLLDESWGHGGYLQWLIHLRMEYTRRRDSILAACEKYLPREVATWNPPAAGMFVRITSSHSNALNYLQFIALDRNRLEKASRCQDKGSPGHRRRDLPSSNRTWVLDISGQLVHCAESGEG